MDFSSHAADSKLDLQISPLVDIVFLLLIYFIMTAALIKKEGDMSFMLPSDRIGPMVVIPVEVLIEISADGAVMAEGMHFSQSDENLTGLITQLQGLKGVADAQQSPFYVNVLPNRDTAHNRVIDVMDACAEAGVKKLSFSKAQ